MSEVTPDVESVRRAVLQHLEGFRRDGVTHWNRIVASAPPTPIVAATVATPARETQQPQESRLQQIPNVTGTSATSTTGPVELKSIHSNPSLSAESESSDVARKKSAVTVPPISQCATFTPLNLPLADRVTGLAALAERVKVCTRCQELASTRTQTVFGVGNPEAKILFVGEAPGADEDAQGEPFVGKSGKLLDDIIKACRIRREDIYICNVLRCRPPGNRLPEPTEAANCREYLDGQIAHVNPDYIVCWGASAAQNLLATTEAIGKLRGRFLSYGRAKVLCTYHPSYLLRNPAAKKDVWEDMKLLFKDMGIDLSAKA